MNTTTYSSEKDALLSSRDANFIIKSNQSLIERNNNINQNILSDIVIKTIKAYKHRNSVKYFIIKIILKIFNKGLHFTLFRQNIECDLANSFDFYLISDILNSEIESCSLTKRIFSSPERLLANSKIKIDLTRNIDTDKFYKIISAQLQEHFCVENNHISDNISYLVATEDSNKLIKTNSRRLYQREQYRFMLYPSMHFPNIIDFLISTEFRNIFEEKFPMMRIAGINLRFSSPSLSESHTTAFHRDYNSYYTVKLFIPLSPLTNPFLEYYPSTELKSTIIPHYSPKHFPKELLPKKIKDSPTSYSSINIKDLNFIPSNCIHREVPSLDHKITLIVTYLSHPDFGFGTPHACRGDLLSKIHDRWSEEHLSFFKPINCD